MGIHAEPTNQRHPAQLATLKRNSSEALK